MLSQELSGVYLIRGLWAVNGLSQSTT